MEDWFWNSIVSPNTLGSKTRSNQSFFGGGGMVATPGEVERGNRMLRSNKQIMSAVASATALTICIFFDFSIAFFLSAALNSLLILFYELLFGKDATLGQTAAKSSQSFRERTGRSRTLWEISRSTLSGSPALRRSCLISQQSCGPPA